MTEPAVDLVLATSTGGIGVHVRSLAAGLVARGHAVTVHGPQTTEDLFGFTAVGAGFAPVEIGAGLRPIADLRAVRVLRRGLRGDVVHAHGLRAGLVAGAALGRRQSGRTPLVTTWHNALLADGLSALLWKRAARFAARRADLTLGASADLVADAQRTGAPRAELGEVAAPTLPAPVRNRDEVRAELGGSGDRPLVVVVARLHAQKGLETLVEAAASLVEPQPLVVVAGDGPLRGALAAQIAALDAPVRLLGRRDDVGDLLRAADLSVIASQWEARALVAQEALLAGTPLVTTAVGGIPDLVGDAAVLVPPGDAAALARAIRGVLTDPAEAARLRAAGLARAATWPDEAAVVDRIAAAYAALLGARP